MPATSAPTTTGYALLGLLSLARMSGYDLARVAAALGHLWPISKTQVYAELRRLEDNGLVAGRAAERSNGPEKTLFELTPEGEGVLDAWAGAADAGSLRVRAPAVLKLLLGHRVAPRATRENLASFRARLAERRARLRSLAAVMESNPDAVYAWAAVLFGVRLCDAIVGWIDEVMPRLPQRRLRIDPRRANPRTAVALLAATSDLSRRGGP